MKASVLSTAHPQKRILALFLWLLIFYGLSAELSFADILVNHTVHTTSHTTGNGASWKIGTGLSGSLTYIQLRAGSNDTVASSSLQVQCFTNSIYTIPCATAVPASEYNMVSGLGDQELNVNFSDNPAFSFDPTKYYALEYHVDSPDAARLYGAASPDDCLTGCNNASGQPYTVLYVDEVPSPDGATNTHFVSVTPYDEQTIATSTIATVGAVIYVNEDDFEDDMFLRIKYARQSNSQAAIANVDGLFTTVDIPIEGPTANFLSDSESILLPGRYTMVQEIRRPSTVSSILSWFGLGNLYDAGLLVSTTTEFFAARPTAYDILLASSTEAINNYIASSTISLSSCTTWTNFGLFDCLNVLFIPQPDKMAQAFTNIKNGFLSYVPFGYVTRAVTILTSTTTADLPDLSYTFASDIGIPVIAGSTLTFSPWSYFPSGGSSVLDTLHSTGAEPKTLWEILDPFFTTIIYLILAYKIINDMTGVFAANRSYHTESL